jgi:hypothetical protein
MDIISFFVMISPSRSTESAIVDGVSVVGAHELVNAVHVSFLQVCNSDSLNLELPFSTTYNAKKTVFYMKGKKRDKEQIVASSLPEATHQSLIDHSLVDTKHAELSFPIRLPRL